MAVELDVLGNVELRVGGRAVDIGPARQRCVLAALVVDANRTVSLEQLVDRVWGDRPPPRARPTLYSYLSRLRGVLAGADDAGITRRPGGYVLGISEAAVDLCRFHRLVAQARAHDDDDLALELFGQALALWRGDAFATLDTPWLAAIRHTVNRERLAAVLDHSDVALRRGRHARLLVELLPHAAEYPLDERLAGQLMLAMYRCGRQAEALERYQQVRHGLAEELGIDPGPPLRQLYQRILTADPALAAPTVTVRETARAPVPRQLPALPRSFTGRTRELAYLTAAVDAGTQARGAVVISAIGGTGGIGKTWLALHWAHQNIDRFPDGQLYVNLRGFDPSGEPMHSSSAVRGFLDALGVDPAVIPVDPDAQAGLYRSLVADRRMLILLDNARDSAHVVPLLPGSPRCTVLITSRHQLGSLAVGHGALTLALDVLTDSEARELLTRHLGADRLAAEPDAIAELLGYCAGLPLALGIVAARAAIHPGFPLAVLADELRETSSRLDALDTGDPAASLRAVFSWSHQALSVAAAGAFGLLGLAPGPDIGLPAASCLLALSTADTGALLRELDAAHLVTQYLPGRYRMHDLVRRYAAEQAQHDHPTAALRRLVDFYLHTAYAADRVIEPYRPPIEIGPPIAGCFPQPLDGYATALAWFDTEHPCLLATQQLAADQGWHTCVWQLAWTLGIFHYRRAHLRDNLVVWHAGLAAAQQLGDPIALASAHGGLGWRHTRAGHHWEAIHHLECALSLAARVGNIAGQGNLLRFLAQAWTQLGDERRALTHAMHALRLFQTLPDDPVGQANALNLVGRLHARLKQYSEARAYCEHALTLHRRHHDRQGEANALDSLGYIARHTGRNAEAFGHYRDAITLYRTLGCVYEEAGTLDNLGAAYAAHDQHAEARLAWHQALDLYQAQHRTIDADRIGQHLAGLDHRPGA